MPASDAAGALRQAAAPPRLPGELIRRLGAAAPGAETFTRHFRFGPMGVSLETADRSLYERLAPAIRHAARAAAPADAVAVGLRDFRGPVPVPAEWRAGLPEGDYVYLREAGEVVGTWQPRSDTWETFDPRTRRGLLATGDLAGIPAWEWAAPLRGVLHWAALATPGCLVHGAAIGDERRGALLVGAGGSGKSTTTAAALLAGIPAAGDDLVLAAPGPEGGFVAHALYDMLKLDRAALDRLDGRIDPFAAPDGPEQPKYHARISAAGSFAPRVKLDAVIRPRLGGGSTRLVPVAPGTAVKALAPATLHLLKGGEAATYAKIARLVKDLPAFVLELGGTPDEAAACLARFLAEDA
jgi:hypothetical protein